MALLNSFKVIKAITSLSLSHLPPYHLSYSFFVLELTRSYPKNFENNKKNACFKKSHHIKEEDLNTKYENKIGETNEGGKK